MICRVDIVITDIHVTLSLTLWNNFIINPLESFYCRPFGIALLLTLWHHFIINPLASLYYQSFSITLLSTLWHHFIINPLASLYYQSFNITCCRPFVITLLLTLWQSCSFNVSKNVDFLLLNWYFIKSSNWLILNILYLVLLYRTIFILIYDMFSNECVI